MRFAAFCDRCGKQYTTANWPASCLCPGCNTTGKYALVSPDGGIRWILSGRPEGREGVYIRQAS